MGEGREQSDDDEIGRRGQTVRDRQHSGNAKHAMNHATPTAGPPGGYEEACRRTRGEAVREKLVADLLTDRLVNAGTVRGRPPRSWAAGKAPSSAGGGSLRSSASRA